MFNKDIREWILQTTDQKTWVNYKKFFHRPHRKQRRAVTTTVKGGYTAAVFFYDVTPTLPEEHNEEIDNLNTIIQGMQKQSYYLEVTEQANAVVTISN